MTCTVGGADRDTPKSISVASLLPALDMAKAPRITVGYGAYFASLSAFV